MHFGDSITSRVVISGALALLLLAHVNAGHAQEPVSNETQAATLRTLGEAALDGGRNEVARDVFAHAHALVPDARALSGYGRALLAQGEVVNAYVALDDALAWPTAPLRGDDRRRATAALGRARARVGRVRVRRLPQGAELTVDSAPAIERRGELIVSPGTHLLTVRVSGVTQSEHMFDAHAGRAITVRASTPPIARTAAHVLQALRGDSGSSFADVLAQGSTSCVGCENGVGVTISSAPEVLRLNLPTVTGNLSADAVYSALLAHKPDLTACIERPEARSLRGGRPVVTFGVAENGVPEHVRFESRTALDASVSGCLERVVTSLRFASVEGRGAVEVRVPLEIVAPSRR